MAYGHPVIDAARADSAAGFERMKGIRRPGRVKPRIIGCLRDARHAEQPGNRLDQQWRMGIVGAVRPIG